MKLPVIWPVPPVIGERMTGAEMTLPSSTMAKGRPTFSVVTCPNFWPPRRLKRKVTSGSPVCWSKLCCASTRSSPSTMTRFCTWIVPPPFCIGRVSTSFGGSPGSATRRNSSLAVWPMISLSLVVSCKPRHLDQHAVDALLLDHRLLGAHRVDAAVQHLDRLRHGVAHLVGDRGVGQRELDAGVGLGSRRACARCRAPNAPPIGWLSACSRS